MTFDLHDLSVLLHGMPVSELMTRAVITVTPRTSLEEAALIMLRDRITALPVVEGDRLVGILTETDLLDLFARTRRTCDTPVRLESIVRTSAAIGEVTL